MNSIYLNNFKSNLHQYVEFHNCIFKDMTTILFSKSNFLIDCYIHSNLKMIFQNVNTTCISIQDDLHYLQNNAFMIFDFDKINHDTTLNFIKCKMLNKLIFDTEILVICKNIHLLSSTKQKVLSKILDMHNKHYYFLLTSQTNTINQGIISKCLTKRVYIENMSKTLKLFCNNESIDDSKVSKIVKKTSNIYTALVCILSDIEYTNIIEKELINIFNIIKKQKLELLVPCVRETIYKLNAYSISNSEICNKITAYIIRKFKNSDFIFTAVSYISKAEHDMLKTSHPLYHFELFFIHLYNLKNK